MLQEVLEAEVLDEIMADWGADVGRRLRRRRQVLGLSLDQVAARAGVSRQTIHRAEQDGRTVRDATRHQIAAALMTDVADLWTTIPTSQIVRRAEKVA